MKCVEEFNKLSRDANDPGKHWLTTPDWWTACCFNVLFKSLDDITERLGRIETETKPIARIDEGYKGGVGAEGDG